MSTDEVLLGKINKAVAAANEIEKTVETAKVELVSRSKAVGLLLLEAKKHHPKVADFEKFLKRVDGLKLSRAYDCMRIAGGRATDEQLRQENRERVQKHRAKKKLPQPELKPEPKPLSVTHPDVTESTKRITQSPEISVEERRAQNAALEAELVTLPESKLMPGGESTYYAGKFIDACRNYLSRVQNESDQEDVIREFIRATKRWSANKKARAA